MTALRVEQVEKVIESIEARPAGETFVEGRYPFTYAYDYLRIHAAEFGLTDGISRSDCAELLRGHPDHEAICVLLADAYLREHRLVRPAIHCDWCESEEVERVGEDYVGPIFHCTSCAHEFHHHHHHHAS